MQTISATHLARHTRDILDRVTHLGDTVAIERNRTVIAQITSPQRSMTAAQALAGLTLPTLTVAQAATWLHDSKGDFDDPVFTSAISLGVLAA